MKLTEREIEYLSGCPDALKLVADFHECQLTEANGMGEQSPYDDERKNELLMEVERLEKEWGLK